MKKVCSGLLRFMFALGIALLILPASPKAEALTPAQLDAVDNAVAQIVAGIPSWADTDEEKALYLHDYVVNNVVYELVGEHQNAYGALIDGKAVCAGYADAYLKLLTAVGIEARTMTGTSKGERHAWTQVYLNGKCYYTDTTWDDPFVDGVQMLTHNYFNLSYKEMAKDHTFDSASIQYVDTSCTHSGIDYYDIMAGEGTGVAIFDDDTTAKEAAKYFILKDVNGTTAYYYCDFRFDGADVAIWRDNTIWSVATELGLTGTRNASWVSGDKGYQMTLSGTKNTVSKVKVTSVSLLPSTLNLTTMGQTYALTVDILPANAYNKNVTFKSSDKTVVKVNSSGVIEAVGEGTATITVTTEDGGKTDTCKVTVQLAHVHDAALKKVAAVEPTCTKDGNIAYYICESCGAWFRNASGTDLIKDKASVTLEAKGHNPSGWKYDKDNHWKICTEPDCNKLIDGTTAEHIDKNGNDKCDTCGRSLNESSDAPPDDTIPNETQGTFPGNTDPSNPAQGTQDIDEKPNEMSAELVEDFMLIGAIAFGVIILSIMLIVIIKK